MGLDVLGQLLAGITSNKLVNEDFYAFIFLRKSQKIRIGGERKEDEKN